MGGVTFYSYATTPVGRLLLTSDGESLTGLYFTDIPKCVVPADDWQEDDAVLADAHRQLTEYFDGQREDFDLPLEMKGSAFQLAVWNALREVGYGRTASYRDIATRIGKPAAVRAVGMTNGRNPIAIIVPCHRVIGANGSLTGYGGGLDRKSWLLDLERGQRRMPLTG
jgi:methylated-DNA-[protein]-cysteine S-methyltransferase